jgi:hypothetical protein
MTMAQIGVELHGVTLNVACEFEPLLDYLRELLQSDVRPVWDAPDLQVTGTWRMESPVAGQSAFGEERSAEGFGKRMRLADDELVWFDTHRDKNLQLRFRQCREQIHFDVDYCYHALPEKLARYPDYQQRKFFKLARYLVHFPVAWHLERTRGWTLIHASAVAARDEAVLVAGPGGAGKTTTCVGLMARAGVRLLTENLLFTDGRDVFPMPEPIRLTGESLALLGDGHRRALVPLGLGGGAKGKSLFRLPDDETGRPVRPVALFIPRFTAEGSVAPIAPALASELLCATNRLTLELNDFSWYTAALDLLWPAPGHTVRQSSVLARLTAQTPCYTLGIDRRAGVEAVVERVLERVGWSQSAVSRSHEACA